MKFLCICQYGHSRSVALARVLHSMKQSAVAIGAITSGDAIEGLSDWADLVLVMAKEHTSKVPDCNKHKIVDMDIGPDR
jgi:hypothetical protein